MMLTVRDRNLKSVGVLENAFDISEEIKLNSLNYAMFNFPLDDKKIDLIEPFGFIETDEGLYRIMPQLASYDEIGTLKVESEHVIATLLDDVIDGNLIIGNIGIFTREVIEFVLSKQRIKHWRLGRCEFDRQFEYAWEDETLLSALWSIPKPFADDYKWEFDTSNYPWTINLVKIDKTLKPKFQVAPRKNQLLLKQHSDYKQLFTRIIPKGYGEGVNQLTIEEVNNGIRYLQAPKHITDKYGIISRIWTDRRYENPESLRDAAQVMLDKFQDINYEYDLDIGAVDERDLEHLQVGNKIRVIKEDKTYFDDFIVSIKYNHDDVETSKITLANQTESIATTIADIADRQRIEMTYAQGATTLYSHAVQANADTKNGAVLNFPVPKEMRIINKVLAKIKIDRFRAYSSTTGGGGKYADTTESGGGSSPTSEFGGVSYPTTNYAGETTRSTTQYEMGGGSIQALNDSYHYGTHNHSVSHGVVYLLTADGGSVQFMPSGAHTHGAHDHEVRIPGHSHKVDMREHRHIVEIKSHTHRVAIPDHKHEIVPGIYKFGNPTSFTIKVGNKVKGIYNETSVELDITDLLLNDKKKITRGAWHTVEVIPNDLAYISIDLFVQGFVQSRGDYTV